MKINVVDRNGYRIGSLDAAVGMRTERGTVEKVNPKSLCFRHASGYTERITDKDYPASITYPEAIRFGFEKLSDYEHEQEIEADRRKRFTQGEYSFNNQMGKPDGDPVAIAGWEFAEATEKLRQLALKAF